jgi:hypothetical protein
MRHWCSACNCVFLISVFGIHERDCERKLGVRLLERDWGFDEKDVRRELAVEVFESDHQIHDHETPLFHGDLGPSDPRRSGRKNFHAGVARGASQPDPCKKVPHTAFESHSMRERKRDNEPSPSQFHLSDDSFSRFSSAGQFLNRRSLLTEKALPWPY